MNRIDRDFLVLGGGLQGGLCALALVALCPGARVVLVEARDRLGSGQVWSAHRGDFLPRDLAWVSPLFGHEWPGYTVHFPSYERRLALPYATVPSARLDELVRRGLREHGDGELLLGRAAEVRSAHEVELDDGRVLRASWILDARGNAAPPHREGGHQKFVGLQLELQHEHGLVEPSVMDARCDQSEGYRFFYVLPFGPRRVLVEDTRFHDDARLDVERLRREVLDYATRRDWKVARVHTEERGVLPMPWRDRAPDAHRAPLRVGMRGGWFHPGTGFSFPTAARLAGEFAAATDDQGRGERLLAFAAEHEGQARYARALNRLLFRWYPPEARVHIFERFYRLPEDTIARFYALRTTPADRARILVGRPPRGLSLRHRLQGVA